MSFFLTITKSKDPTASTPLREDYRDDVQALLEAGCKEVCFYHQTLFPGSALVFPLTALGAYMNKHSRITKALAIESSHLLFTDSNEQLFLSLSTVGIESTTLFEDGSLMLTSLIESEEHEDIIDTKKARYFTNGTPLHCLRLHREKLEAPPFSEPITAARTLEDFKKHCKADLQGVSPLLLQLLIPNWIFVLIVALIAYLAFLILNWCAATIPYLSTAILASLLFFVHWKNKFFQNLDVAMRLERSYSSCEAPQMPRRTQKTIEQYQRELIALQYSKELCVKDLLQESIGIYNTYLIFLDAEHRVLAYLTINTNKHFIRGLLNLLQFQSYANPQCMVSFQTIFSEYAQLNSYESYVDSPTTRTGETLHQHEYVTPIGYGISKLNEGHQKRILELIDSIKLQPRTFDTADAILEELESRAKELKDEWLSSVDPASPDV